MIRSVVGGSWWIAAIPILVAGSALYLLSVLGSGNGGSDELVTTKASCSTAVGSAECADSEALFNRFGFTPETSGSGSAAIGTTSLLPLDNYVLSWDREAEWQKGVNQQTALKKDFVYASKNYRTPMLTLEPWPTAGRSSRTLLLDIVAGKYDDSISWVCQDIRDYGRKVFVRWGHEMENVTGRYPWATTNASAYVNAYRHFVTRCRGLASNVYYLWSPAGNKNLQDYWPGPEYVDYIGLTVFDYEAWELRYYGHNRDFVENFSERYAYVKAFNLPIIIAECGATGPRRDAWINDAFRSAVKLPQVKSVVLFTALDPVSWGPMPPPDWRLSPATAAESPN